MSLHQDPLNASLTRTLDLPDYRAIAEIRLILALATLAAASFITTRLTILAYTVIAAYIATALVLYWFVLNRPILVRQRPVYLLDAACLLAIIGTTGGTGNPLFLLLLFPILVAAAQAGFVEGMLASLSTVMIYLLLAVATGDASGGGADAPLEAGFLLALGFMVSRWASAENQLKHKLSLLTGLGQFSGLHNDVAPFWQETLAELSTYFSAESAFLVTPDENGASHIYEYDAGMPFESMVLPDAQARVFAEVPERWIIGWCAFFHLPPHGAAHIVDAFDGEVIEAGQARLEALAQTLETRQWLSFPLHSGQRYVGRLFFLGVRRFKCRLEWPFIQQLAGQIALKSDNLTLARQLTRVAATGERERISRDLHDGTVQPYLGLKYGLEALRRKVPSDHPLAADVGELVRMTDEGIRQLRGYIHDLRSAEADGQRHVPAVIQAQVQQFEEYSGLKVDLRAQAFDLSEQRLLEVRQLIAEGLSNIRRHTAAKRATLEMLVEQGTLRIAFINPVSGLAAPFTPRSLTERSAVMGGSVEVMRLATQTIVKAVLPLWTEKTP